MQSIKQFLHQEQLDEKMITLGNQAYPKFGTVVILAGGAGSGKGFTLEKLLGVEGHVLDVDHVKKLAMGITKNGKIDTKVAARIKRETGEDITSFDLRKPENVSKIHMLMTKSGLIKGREQAFMASAALAHPSRKPNIIFDVTLKDIGKLKKISQKVLDMGYKKENIHIVWVMNDIDVALDQNAKRDRVVPRDILFTTHAGASKTMTQILNMGDGLSAMADGDIWISFNKRGVDSEVETSKTGGFYVKAANTIKVKSKGKKSLTTDKLVDRFIGFDNVVDKIKAYAPKGSAKKFK